MQHGLQDSAAANAVSFGEGKLQHLVTGDDGSQCFDLAGYFCSSSVCHGSQILY